MIFIAANLADCGTADGLMRQPCDRTAGERERGWCCLCLQGFMFAPDVLTARRCVPAQTVTYFLLFLRPCPPLFNFLCLSGSIFLCFRVFTSVLFPRAVFLMKYLVRALGLICITIQKDPNFAYNKKSKTQTSSIVCDKSKCLIDEFASPETHNSLLRDAAALF